MKTAARLAGLLITLLTAACESSPREAIELTAPLTERLSGNVTHALTGGGKVDVSAFDPDLRPELYAFSAILSGDGVASGQVEMHLSDPAVKLHGEVTCLAVSGTSAWVGGVFVRSSNPRLVAPETQFWARVDDGGEGPNAIDRISFVRIGPPASRCHEMRPVGMPFAFTDGNLQVR